MSPESEFSHIGNRRKSTHKEILGPLSGIKSISFQQISNTTLFILVPPVVKVPLANKEGQHHKQLILDCQIHGFPIPDIKWFKNGKEIKQTKVSY